VGVRECLWWLWTVYEISKKMIFAHFMEVGKCAAGDFPVDFIFQLA